MSKIQTRTRSSGKRGWLILAAALLLFSAVPGHVLGAPQINERSLARITAYGGGAGTGTGFLISSGHIVTAYHVVHGARRIDVVLDGQYHRDVEVVAVRPETDLALLHAPTSPTVNYYRTVEGPTGAPGSYVYVHGVPLGFDKQLLVGRLTQSGYLLSQVWADRHGQSLFAVKDLSLVPLDITSEPGVSGGPVLDESGNVFGVFSGSLQAGGRGYSWAVPMFYTNMKHMRPLNKPASAITQWPDFVYLRPGLSLLRSLSQNSEAARFAKRCLERIDAYTETWESQLEAGTHYMMKWTILKPSFDSILKSANAYGARSQMGKFRLLWEALKPQTKAFEEAQLEFEKSTAQLVTACYSHTLINSLIPEDVPATRENVLFDAKISKRMRALDDANKRSKAAGLAIEEDAQSKIAELFALHDTLETSNETEVIQNLLQALALLEASVTAFLSKEQADYIAHIAQGARVWTEIIEAIELRSWEREYQTYSYQDPSGIGLSLSNGWASFDRELRDAMLAPGQTMPDFLDLVKLGSLGNVAPPQAMAEVSWQPSYSIQSTDSSQASAYWNKVNNHWSTLQQREGTTFVNAKRYTNQVADDLLLEMTGDGQLPNGTVFSVYVGYRFDINGTASLTCTLISPELGYGSCTGLMDSMRLPN